MASITFSGLASGIDSESIITQLVAVETQPITTLQTKQQANSTKSSKLGQLNTKLQALQTAMKALDTSSEANPTSVTSSDTSIFTVSSTGGVSTGRYDVRVEQLAKAGRIYSDGVSGRGTTGLFGAGTIQIKVGEADSVDISVDSTDTLDSVVSKINASGADVTASVLYDGTNYRMQIAGKQTGAANALTLTELGTTLGLATPTNVVSSAQDARMTIDGVSVTRSTNTFENVLAGVTITAQNVSSTGTTQRLDVANDTTSLETKIQAVVDAYNAVNSFITTESTFNGTAKGAESLVGDSTLRSVQSRLRSTFVAPINGLSGKYNTFGSIGVTMQRDGSLSLDATKLTTALSADPTSVTNILTKETDGLATRIDAVIDSFTNSSSGVLQQRMTSLSKLNKQLDTQIDSIQTRIDKYESTLRAQYAALETTMSTLNGQKSQLEAILGTSSS